MHEYIHIEFPEHHLRSIDSADQGPEGCFTRSGRIRNVWSPTDLICNPKICVFKGLMVLNGYPLVI